jgi:hypothetical protein
MRVRRAAAVAALAIALAAAPTAAQSVVPGLDVKLTVGADGVVTVRESITFRPTAAAPVAERRIRLRALDNRPLRVTDITMTDARDAAVRVSLREGGDAIVVRTRDAFTIDADRHVRLRLSYRVYRSIRPAEDGHWLEWTVAPWSWATARLDFGVELPPTVPSEATVDTLVTRAAGGPWPAEIRRTASGIQLSSALPPRRAEVRILVTWPGAHVDLATPEPPVPWSSRLRFDLVWAVPGVLFGIGGVVAIGRRLSRARVVAAYAPPPSLRPGEAGVVIDGRVDTQDVVAAVVDLAVRGYLRLEPGADDEIMVTVARVWRHDPDIRPHELVLLAHVFTDGVHTVRLSELRGQGESPTAIKNVLSHDLTARGFFHTAPRAVRAAGLTLSYAVLGVWMQLSLNTRGVVATALTGVLTAAAIWWLLRLLFVGGLTPKGRHARQELRGYSEYLRRVEKPRLDRLTPGTLDPHLPWAIALRVSDAWLATTPNL